MAQVITVPGKIERMRDFLRTAPEGCVVEVGVFEGGSLHDLAISQPHRQFYGYDTFAGMPEATTPDNHHRAGDFMTTLETAQETVKHLSNVQLIKGIYPKSDTVVPKEIAMAHVDVDLYKSTYESFVHIAPFMVPGGRIYCDDCFYTTCEGATMALCRFCTENNIVPHVSFVDGVPFTYLQF